MMSNYNIRKQIRSFGFAWKGVVHSVSREQNLRFHLTAAAVTILLGAWLRISRTEWLLVILCIGLVIAAEMVNTAIERLTDLTSPAPHPLAGQAKDVAAGAVLVCAITAACIGLLIFVPHLIGVIKG